MTKPGAAMYIEYARMIEPGELVTRHQMARRVGRPYSTVVYNLERAATEGLLIKQVVWGRRGQTAWAYARAESAEGLL